MNKVTNNPSSFLRKENVQLKLKENLEKIKLNKQLPYLVSNVVEVSLPHIISSLNKDFRG